MSVRRLRLDDLLVERGLAETKSKAHALVMAGKVLVAESLADKPGRQVADDVCVRVTESARYVSRGGLKLEAALEAFGADPTGCVCADVGASTGGFTDCLLQRGAARVYAIDVGYGQMAWSLRQDSRVVLMERCNIRHLASLPELVDLATIDVSFIGLELVLPVVSRLLAPGAWVISLIKPQFQVGKGLVGRHGVVRDPALHRGAIRDVLNRAAGIGLGARGLIRSPIVGPAGNVEFLAAFRQGHASPLDAEIAEWTEQAVKKPPVLGYAEGDA